MIPAAQRALIVSALEREVVSVIAPPFPREYFDSRREMTRAGEGKGSGRGEKNMRDGRQKHKHEVVKKKIVIKQSHEGTKPQHTERRCGGKSLEDRCCAQEYICQGLGLCIWCWWGHGRGMVVRR